MTVPLRHVLVALAFLVLAAALGVAVAAGVVDGTGGLVHVHLALVGWVCLTIMGAMTQFVPVWSGVELHARRLATVQLPLVAVGVLGLAIALLSGSRTALPAVAFVLLAGFWTFAYNVGRTLLRARPLDVTERHFAAALVALVVVAGLGAVLALDLLVPVLGSVGVDRSAVVGAHATVAVFGVVVVTLVGALYQLATMFTATRLDRFDRVLQRVEEATLLVGVTALATGRLAQATPLARVGAGLTVLGAVAFGIVLVRKLGAARDFTPMLARYVVAAVALFAWAVPTAVVWAGRPLGVATRFGAPSTEHLLFVGLVGFVVLGTLYHVVPFVVWVHRYADRIGYGRVPAVDELYSRPVARVDLALTASGLLGMTVAEVGAVREIRLLGGVLVTAGALVATANLALVVRRHSPYTVPGLVLGLSGGEDDRMRSADPR